LFKLVPYFAAVILLSCQH